MASSGSHVQKRSGLLTYSGSSNLIDVPSKEIWVQCPIVRDYFWEAAQAPTYNSPHFEDIDDDKNHHYSIYFKTVVKERVS